jgi:hypothetical protein
MLFLSSRTDAGDLAPADARDRGGVALRFQVLTIRSGKVVDIAGFDGKTEALSYDG